ncbi:hypothetical protein TVAG_216750 [Trichomonas vaginalis G3]|uniref:Ral GTPase-activating protein subunit alpha/beta N-terminal domain-containing protein n=1 Tax=Trichomonas vaginalis (strain ATCC PRA-98 / G3) TaxID=412133 RepID=A2FE81_TRIV3|nr:hypothetical protein TVAGG3_0233480 [Trichomonas vaginalis G3]EAX96772.1 hypothetical protein TVAG_216750 [Trichomonas vaginalis G3]KAI5552816.1 hypothetical protein TVAGG3_0233480 [Trichomonas vaginalis G3]|eukprot:XP_001309702.1 hypothetical protein [Trichomonas vaginalis G3]
MDTPPILMLKFLKESDLLSEDKDCYSLTTVPQDVAEAGTKVFLSDFKKRQETLDLTRKKRVKFIMEFLAVAFGLEIQEYTHIETAKNIYHNWFSRPEIFGDVKRQNKFFRRMFKHMTQPFQFRAAISKDIFETKFFDIIMAILDEYDNFAETAGKLFEVETWEVLFKCTLAIANSIIFFNYRNLLVDEKQVQLRQKAITVYFNVCLTSGIVKPDFWKLFNEYCFKWSINLDFIKVWGVFVQKLTKIVFSRVLKFETDEFIEGGIYTGGKSIDSKTLNFIYHHFLYCIDHDMTMKTPDNLDNFQQIILNILNGYTNYAKHTSPFYIPRFPAKTFLQMFGPAITHIDLKLNAEFDYGLSTMLGTLLLVASNLQFQQNEETRLKILQLALSFAKIGRPQLVASFLINGANVFGKWSDFHPFMAESVLMFIPKLDLKQTKRFDPGLLYHCATGMFISASEIYSRSNNDLSMIANAFHKLYNETPHDQNKVALLTYASKFENINIFAKIAEAFSLPNIRKASTDDSIPFYSTLITLVGTVTRYNQSYIDMFNQLHLLPLILTAVTSSDLRKLQNSDMTIAAALVMIYSLIEYCNDVLNVKENVNSIFEYAAFVQKLIDNDKKVPLKNKRLIKGLLSTIYARANIHYPSYEYFTRNEGKICGTENDICEKYKMIGCRKYYFTISNSLLITFMEMPNGTQPIVILVRGPFGRVAWLIEDHFKTEEKPILSERIQKVDLKAPEPSNVEPYDPADEDKEEPLGIPHIEITGFSDCDKQLHDHFVEVFTKWLSIDDFGFIEKFGKETPYFRPRVVDFLLSAGILDSTNKLKVVAQQNRTEVNKVIKNFDKLDKLPKVPVQISHITLNDRKFGKNSIRNSAAMAQFMQVLGEPMKIDDKFLATLPIAGGIAKFIDSENDFSLRLVFNESGYDYVMPQIRKQVISVSPVGSGLYKVTEKSPAREGISPFSKFSEYVVTMKTLRFMITTMIDASIRYVGKFECFDVCAKRREMFKELTDVKTMEDLAPLSVLEFKVV